MKEKVYRLLRKEDGKWNEEMVIDVKEKKVEGWMIKEMKGMMGEIIM
jgi:hypothetical protein